MEPDQPTVGVDLPVRPSRAAAAWVIVAASLILLWSVVATWLLAIPAAAQAVCPAVHPAPAGCSPARVPVAALWSAILIATYATVTILAVKARHRGFGALIGGVVLLAALAFAAHRVTLQV
ncbi:hypothetical protein [Occultella kanbiaonis]|uniref:hypothetical protein n=1 Tax=Occultella kanbiaonis TaxID=2675754 RepID=UPI0012B9D977|nr:hypothetical protein [Occultella kanbiaonis]